MTISYPAGLPHPLREGYGFEPENNILRTPMQSGRARQRQSFTKVPTYANLSWIFKTVQQAQLFEAWADQVAGAEWFDMTLSSPIGLQVHQVRFMASPVGPARVGNRFWSFTARVELREKPQVDPDWALILPAYILMSDIFDLIPNREWPESEFGMFSFIFDKTINSEWPLP